MAKHDFRTPSSIPIASTGRCIVVPDDAAWLGLLNAALLMLTEHWRYDQVETTDLTPEETAAVWYDIYVSTLTSNCEDCPDMNCNDVLECVLPYLEASFYEDADIRINPVTNAPQVSYDGGTTWSDIPQSGDGSINAPQPTPTTAPNNSAKICLASSRAALVIAEFYKQSFGAFTADLYNALGTANTFLQDVKMVLFNAIYSPYDGILEAAGFLTQDFETNYTAAELSSGALEDLLCLLIENASVDASGVVTFDYGAVRDNVIADVGINPGTALWFLLGNMQEAGLNASGSVRITDDPLDCSPCTDVWCYRFEFNESNGGFSGIGSWDGTQWQSIAQGNDEILHIKRAVSEGLLTRVRYGYAVNGWSVNNNLGTLMFWNDTTLVKRVGPTHDHNAQVSGTWDSGEFAPVLIDEVGIEQDNYGTSGRWSTVQWVEYSGIGTSPFGASNC